jgi:hypothetical protein
MHTDRVLSPSRSVREGNEERSVRPPQAAAVVLAPSLLLAGVVAAGTARAGLPSNCSRSGSTVSCTFSSTGAEQSFSVPARTTSVQIEAVGAAGGLGSIEGQGGGPGGVARGTLSVTGGETLHVVVGAAGGQAEFGGSPGFNGGGAGNGEAGGGGGASDVRTAPLSAGLAPDTGS